MIMTYEQLFKKPVLNGLKVMHGMQGDKEYSFNVENALMLSETNRQECLRDGIVMYGPRTILGIVYIDHDGDQKIGRFECTTEFSQECLMALWDKEFSGNGRVMSMTSAELLPLGYQTDDELATIRDIIAGDERFVIKGHTGGWRLLLQPANQLMCMTNTLAEIDSVINHLGLREI
jgi:hypothetical protein